MPNDIDKQVRNQIKEIIQPAYPDAVIYPFNALSHELGEWPGLFRLDDGGVHGWIIKRAAVSGDWKNIVKTRDTFDYDIWAFYKFRPEGTESSNSDDEFGTITDTAYEDLKAKPLLDLEGIVDRHDLLQFPAITTINCGEETLHFAQGRLSVHLCC